MPTVAPDPLRSALMLAVLALLLTLVGSPPASAARYDGKLAQIVAPQRVLSTSGGVEVAVRVRPGSRSRFDVGGRNVTERFGHARDGVLRARLRLGKELALGVNHVAVTTQAGARRDFDSVEVVLSRRHSGFLTVSEAPRRATGGLPEFRASWRNAPHDFSARLNGRDVSHEFVTRTGTAKRARLGPDDGLRFGRNRLVVSAYDRAGRFDREVRRFRVRRTRPLVGTGPDRTVTTGMAIRLDGRASRPARGGRLRHRWSIVRRPRGSKARLRNAASPRPTLVPDVRGRYRLRLRVTERGGPRGRKRSGAAASQLQPLTAAATMEVLAPALPDPLGYPVSTIPAAGSGIQIAGTTYPASGNWVQVVTLDRATLEPKDVPRLALPQANHPGPGQYAFNTGDVQSLRNLVNGSASGIDASYLVAMTGGGRSIDIAKPQWQALTYAFGQLGGTLDPFLNDGKGNSDPGFGGGNWSLIGIPDLSPGAAAQNWNLAPSPNEPAGDLQGRLTWDSQDHFTFVGGDYRSFDTNTTDQGAAAGGTNYMSVAGVTYASSALAPGQSGFHVVTLDAGGLGLVGNDTFVTNDGGGQVVSGVQQMAAKLNAASSKSRYVVVFVQSIGSPNPLNSAWTGPAAKGKSSLAGAIDAIGGTADVFNSLAAGGSKWGYTLVGGTNLDATQAAEIALNPENPTAAKPPTHLQGSLKRGDQFRFQPVTTSSFDSPVYNGFDLSAPQLAFRTTTAKWPTHDTPAHQAAEDYIARRIFYSDLPPSQRGYDLHTYYWYADWLDSADSYASALGNVCPSGGSVTAPPGSPFSSTDLQFVCNQIRREFTYVQAVWGMTRSVRDSFVQQEISGPSSASSIATSLANALNKQRSSSPESELVADVLLVEGTLLEAASEVIFAAARDGVKTDLGAAASIGVMSGLFDMASDLANGDSGQPDLASFDTEAKNLGFEIQARYKNAIAASDKLAQLLVSDPEKLSIAGPKALDPQSWGFGQDRLATLRDSLELSTTRYLWSKLLPGAFKVYNLGAGGSRWLQEGQGKWTPKSYRCYNNTSGTNGGEIVWPWRNSPASGWLAQTVGIKSGKPYRQPNVIASSKFRFGGYGGNHTVEYYGAATAPKSITDPLFQPVVYDQFSNTNATLLTQVGLNKPEFLSTSQGLFERVDVRC